jgi:GTPase SAR1 family protein
MVHKLLLLGAGESGKSTLFKQITKIYRKNFYTEEECLKFVPIIHSNTISAIQRLCKATFSSSQDAELKNSIVTDEKSIECMKRVTALRPLDDPLTEDIASDISTLWADGAIQAIFAKRGEFSIPDSAEYFFGRLDATWKSDYIPTFDDVLRSRVRTTGILDQKYTHNQSNFHLFDVGGQRNERKKWIHVFEGVTAILFVASLSGYDQILYEDQKTNRLHESLKLFAEICDYRYFLSTNIILFLNKKDLFLEKIKDPLNTLSACFPEYKEEEETLIAKLNSCETEKDRTNAIKTLFDSGVDHCQSQFEQRIKQTRRKDDTFYTHITDATDTNQCEAVFVMVQEILIRKSLKQAGLLMS